MLTALTLSLAQLSDPRIVRVMAKSIGIALLLFAMLAWAGWWLIDLALAWAGLADGSFASAGEVRGLAALLITVIGGWLLWRILALAVLQFFADDVVKAVEARHYPAALAAARTLEWREELANSARGAGRALGYNLLAVPVALVLLVTGVGAPLVFMIVNALLLGRELTEMVWLRHVHAPGPTVPLLMPLGRLERLALGGVVVALMMVPFVNLLAPFLGAAAATHLVHRKGASLHAL